MSAAVTRQAGLHWRGEVAGAITSAGYEVNDLGFAVRTDRKDAQATVQYLENLPGDFLRRWSVTAVGRSEHNTVWQPILSFVYGTVSATTLGYWSTSLTVRRMIQAFDDRLTRGGPIAVRPASTQSQLNVTSDARLPATGILTAYAERTEAGGWTTTTGLSLGIKTSTRWNLTVGPTFTRAFVPAQYVTTVTDAGYAPTFGRRYVFAPLTQTQLGIEGRLNVTFTPQLSLETYVQPLLSSGDYQGATQLVAPQTFDFVPYAGAIPNLDFNLRSLRGNAVLRWEWRTGSTLFLAWQQQRSDLAAVGDFAIDRDRAALFSTRPDNIFVLKMNYWLNP
jgi:hypothetical protein